LYATLSDLEGLFRLRAEVRRLSFVVCIAPDVPRYVIGDEGRLRQVLLNLVGNALKFTHEGTIMIEATVTPEGAHMRLMITVADTGEGMRPDEIATLFRPFAQTESGRRSQDGTGLGLALSRQLARLMGGDIVVTSMPGAGSTFSVVILVDPASASPEAATAQRVLGLVTAGRRYRALVAVAHWQTRRLLAEWLHVAGIEVREAPDGPQALGIWADWRPHIMLIDTQLPLIDGFEAARRVRESPAGRSTVVIALSGEPLPTDAPGCDDVLDRDVHQDELLTCVARHLGLDLHYAEEPVAIHTSHLARADLAELPPVLREQLAAAAASSDPVAVAAVLNHLAEGWPDLARRIGALADEFQFDTIELLAADD
jgi:CheY-like chemotaxis protein